MKDEIENLNPQFRGMLWFKFLDSKGYGATVCPVTYRATFPKKLDLETLLKLASEFDSMTLAQLVSKLHHRR